MGSRNPITSRASRYNQLQLDRVADTPPAYHLGPRRGQRHLTVTPVLVDYTRCKEICLCTLEPARVSPYHVMTPKSCRVVPHRSPKAVSRHPVSAPARPSPSGTAGRAGARVPEMDSRNSDQSARTRCSHPHSGAAGRGVGHAKGDSGNGGERSKYWCCLLGQKLANLTADRDFGPAVTDQ